jgi:hypothetical protein
MLTKLELLWEIGRGVVRDHGLRPAGSRRPLELLDVGRANLSEAACWMTFMTADTKSELDQTIERLFDYWADGADRRWARHVWGLLADAGVVSDDLAAEGPQHAEQLATLSAMALLSGQLWSLVYCGTEEGFELPEVVGEYPLLTELELGCIAAERGVLEVNFESLAELALFVAAEALSLLLVQISGIQRMSTCFAELWAQRNGGEYPLSDEDLDDILNHPSLDSMMAFGWFDQLWPRELSASVGR